MFKEYEVTEIDFLAFQQGEKAQAMRNIVKRSRRRGKARKPTAGVVPGLLSSVRLRLRCVSIAARGLSCQQTGDDVSAAPYSLNML
jgi:hypothetical protein